MGNLLNNNIILIDPQPDWIRPASGKTDVWHGYCGSGPENGLKCPFGLDGRPVEIEEKWYWIKTK